MATRVATSGSTTLGDSLSRSPFATTSFAADLNDCELDATAIKQDTANAPVAGMCGICFTCRATGQWFWQIALRTEGGEVYVRRKINDLAWTAWKAL